MPFVEIDYITSSRSRSRAVPWNMGRLTESSPEEKINALIGTIEADPPEAQDVRVRAVSSLGTLLSQHPLSDGIQCLLRCIQREHDPQVILHAISVLSRIKAEDGCMTIVDVLLGHHVVIFDEKLADEDEMLRLRCGAANALGRLGDNRAIIPLMSVLNDKNENYRLRLAVAESLGRLGDEYAVNPLLDILRDEREKSIYLKESVAKALGMLGDIRAIEPLIEMLESKKGIRDKFNFLKEQIIEAIGRIGRPNDKAADTLMASLKDEAPSIRLAAVEALGVIGDEDAIGSLRQCVLDEDDDVAKAAIYAIYNLGGEEAVRVLLSLENLPQFLRDELESYIP